MSAVLPELPVARYDLVSVYGAVPALVARWAGWDTARNTGVIAARHLVGLPFELVKARPGSRSHPEDAFTKVAGVPLYGGLLHAAVGSRMCRAWRRLDGRRPVASTRSGAWALLSSVAFVLAERA